MPFFRIVGPDFQMAPLPRRSLPPVTRHASPGTVLQGRYAILDIMGRGGMGTVYEAEDTQVGNKRIAVKSHRAERRRRRA